MAYSFRPSLAATISLVIALAILIGLGTWQLQRLSWKADLIDRISERVSAEPVDLPQVIAPGDVDDWDYRPVRVSGVYRHDAELHLVARTSGGRSGVHVVTPLQRADGGYNLVNRGWVPDLARDQGVRADGLPQGPVTLTAIARSPEAQSWMQPDNDPARNDWFWPDLPAMAAEAGVDDPGPLVLEVIDDPATPPGAFPIPGQTRIDIPNNHLEYALTWYALALTMVGVYVVFFSRRKSGGGSGEERSAGQRNNSGQT